MLTYLYFIAIRDTYISREGLINTLTPYRLEYLNNQDMQKAIGIEFERTLRAIKDRDAATLLVQRAEIGEETRGLRCALYQFVYDRRKVHCLDGILKSEQLGLLRLSYADCYFSEDGQPELPVPREYLPPLPAASLANVPCKYLCVP